MLWLRNSEFVTICKSIYITKMQLVLVIIATVSILIFKAVYETTLWGPVVGSAMNAVAIVLLEMLYKIIAIKINDMENYRTDSEYENGLIRKLFLFQFINAYLALFYIAFIKPFTKELFGVRLYCKGYGNYLEILRRYGSNLCLEELSINLAILFVTRIVVSNFIRIALPFLQRKLCSCCIQQKFEIEKLSRVRKQVYLSILIY